MPSVKLKVLLGYMMTSALIPCLHPKSAVSMGTGVSTQGQRGGVNEEGVSARGVVLGRLSRAQGSPPSSPSRLHSQDLTPSKELTERPVTGPKAIEQMGRALWAPAAPRVLQTWSSHLQMGPATRSAGPCRIQQKWVERSTCTMHCTGKCSVPHERSSQSPGGRAKAQQTEM